MNTSEIIFEVTEAVEGGYDAKALGHSIFTQGEDWEDLKAMVKSRSLPFRRGYLATAVTKLFGRPIEK